MLKPIWSSGTCPGPSTIACTPASRARCTSSPSVCSSASCAGSEASARQPGRSPSPSEYVTSYSRMIALISSNSSYIGFCLPCCDHPLGEQRAAARDDAGDAVPDQRQVLAQHAGVDREVVDALLRLALDLLQDDVVAEILDAAADDHAVDRHRADRHRRVVDDRLPARGEVAAGREVHQRVGAVVLRPAQLLDLLRVSSSRPARRRCWR